MRLHTARPEDLATLRAALDSGPGLVVASLCAAWCHTCRDFMPAFAALAASRPRDAFVWLDIEDDGDLVGDVEVEDFPTLAVFREGALVHLAASRPQEAVVARLLEALAEGAAPLDDPAAAALLRRLARD